MVVWGGGVVNLIPQRKLVVYANANCEMACPSAMKKAPVMVGKYMKIVLTLDKRESRLRVGFFNWAGPRACRDRDETRTIKFMTCS